MACRRRRPKTALLRIARRADRSAAVDPTGRGGGRGAYLCRDDAVCTRAVTRTGTLDRALGVRLGTEDLARLATEIEQETRNET